MKLIKRDPMGKKSAIKRAMFPVYLSRGRFIVDARTVVYLNIATEEKTSKLAARVLLSAAWETLLSRPSTIPIIAKRTLSRNVRAVASFALSKFDRP